MSAPRQRYNTTYDLSNCDAEPLRFIRCCQHGAALMVLYADNLRIKAVSENAKEAFGRPAADLLGEHAGAVLGEEAMTVVRDLREDADLDEINPVEYLQRRGDTTTRKNLILHRQDDLLLLELEDRDPDFGSTNFLLRIDRSLARIQSLQSATESELFDVTVREVRKLTGYDRVYLYRFDKDYNGQIIAEAKRPEMPAYLHLHYPHTDIPKQARELYFSQQIRQVTSTAEDCDHLLLTDDDAPINLTAADNRGVSPIHLEYLRNVGVGASMSIAVIVNGRLWGLIACHHLSARTVDYRLRKMLGFFGRILSGHLALHQTANFRNSILASNLVRARLVDRLNEAQDIVTPFLTHQEMILDLMQADGAALIIDEQVIRTGECPTEEELGRLLEYVQDKPPNVVSTAELRADFPESRNFSTAPAGLLSIRISRNPREYLFWFRAETVTKMAWGGRPEHRKEVVDGKVRLHPNISFAKYVESQEGRSVPWARHHLDNALALRNDIKEIILVKYQEMRHLNNKLVSAYEELQSFSYTVSHDLRAPLRGIKGFAEILQEDYAEHLDDFGQSALRTIVASVNRMNTFINGILEFSRVGSGQLRAEPVALETLLEEVWTSLPDEGDVRFRHELNVPTIPGDHTLLWQLFQNFIGNSVKYRRPDVATEIVVRTLRQDDHVLIEVEDNGIGFDVKHAGQIFTPFTRLVREEEYEGTGIGLAIAHRIVQKHRGRIDVHSVPGAGTTFRIFLPHDLVEQLDARENVSA